MDERPMIRTMLAMVLMTAVAPAAAQQPTTAEKPAGTAAKPDKKICRREVPTGSRMAKSTCHLASEWADIDRANEANTAELSRRANTTSN
jgi:hypothetical protein